MGPDTIQRIKFCQVSYILFFWPKRKISSANWCFINKGLLWQTKTFHVFCPSVRLGNGTTIFFYLNLVTFLDTEQQVKERNTWKSIKLAKADPGENMLCLQKVGFLSLSIKRMKNEAQIKSRKNQFEVLILKNRYFRKI